VRGKRDAPHGVDAVLEDHRGLSQLEVISAEQLPYFARLRRLSGSPFLEYPDARCHRCIGHVGYTVESGEA
jgi:hypothetical protein